MQYLVHTRARERTASSYETGEGAMPPLAPRGGSDTPCPAGVTAEASGRGRAAAAAPLTAASADASAAEAWAPSGAASACSACHGRA